MTDIAIKVPYLSKCYQIYDNPRDRLKQFVAPRLQRLTWQNPKQYFREFWALKVASSNRVIKIEKQWQGRTACD